MSLAILYAVAFLMPGKSADTPQAATELLRLSAAGTCLFLWCRKEFRLIRIRRIRISIHYLKVPLLDSTPVRMRNETYMLHVRRTTSTKIIQFFSDRAARMNFSCPMPVIRREHGLDDGQSRDSQLINDLNIKFFLVCLHRLS